MKHLRRTDMAGDTSGRASCTPYGLATQQQA